MLKVTRNPEFTTTARVLQPADGGQTEGQFKIRFRAKTLSERAAYDLNTPEGTDAFFRAVIIGWFELMDEDGAAFEFSPANLNLLLDLAPFRMAFTHAYFDATSGIKAAKRGN